MQYQLAPELLNRFVESLRSRYDERDGIHVSDLIYCLRESYFKKTAPKQLTETQLMFFLDGARRHTALQSLSDVKCEVRVEGLGIVGTIDMLSDEPVEFKSTRSRSGVPDHYLRQLGYYCVLVDSQRGVLVIQRIMNYDAPFEFYTVEYTMQDLEDMKRQIEIYRTNLQHALDHLNPSGLPFAEEDWKCKSCTYKTECEEASS